MVLNQGDMTAADRIFEIGVLFHYPLGDLEGANAVKRYVEAVRIAFPDICFKITDLVGEGDRVAARWSLTGTQSGPFKGRAPSGRKVNVPGITMFHFQTGKICEMWVSFDPALLIDQ